MANKLATTPITGNIVFENQDGTVSVYTESGPTPVILTKTSCEVLKSTYVFDINTQKCMWRPMACNLAEAFKLVLNPNGNDGALFYFKNGDDCFLNIDFDYLFKLSCADLFNISQNTQSPISVKTQQQIATLETKISQQTITCESISNQIDSITAQINSTSYSIDCPGISLPSGRVASIIENTLPSPSSSRVEIRFPAPLSSSRKVINSKSGFGFNPAPFGYFFSSFAKNVIYCLTEPDGLQVWANILGPKNYQNFLDGDATSFSCLNVENIVSMNDVIVANNAASPNNQQPLLLNVCKTAFGTKTNLIKQLNDLLTKKLNCEIQLTVLNIQLDNLNATLNATSVISCSTPVEVLELLDVSVTLDVISSANTLQTVYEFPLFPAIGLDNLYSYLVSHPTNSGFYVCDASAPFAPMVLASVKGRPRTGTCRSIVDNVLNDLFTESNLNGTPNGQTIFENTLPQKALESNWLHYTKQITDPLIISQIANKKIKLSIKINHTCSNVCVLIDEISLNKACTETNNNHLLLTQSPGFELDRVRDNKKSWLANNTPINRQFVISDNNNTNDIRQTNYDVNDERLVINTKEIDLDLSLASAIETDVWCYVVNSPCLLSAVTTGSTCSACTGDNLVDFNSLMTQPLSAVTTIEDFEYFITSELIDAKDRQTLSGYPTLRALYDRYVNSSLYCSTHSSAFNYMTMDQFATLLGNYWVDIIEQVIPATTIWGSVKIYSNTIFDQQKFKYKSYSSLFCVNPFSGQTVSSPINGTNGMCETGLGVTLTTIHLPSATGRFTNQITTCDTVCIAQMNAGSEFIGTVTITP